MTTDAGPTTAASLSSSDSSHQDFALGTETHTVVNQVDTRRDEVDSTPYTSTTASRWSMGILNVPDVTDVPGMLEAYVGEHRVLLTY